MIEKQEENKKNVYNLKQPSLALHCKLQKKRNTSQLKVFSHQKKKNQTNISSNIRCSKLKTKNQNQKQDERYFPNQTQQIKRITLTALSQQLQNKQLYQSSVKTSNFKQNLFTNNGYYGQNKVKKINLHRKQNSQIFNRPSKIQQNYHLYDAVERAKQDILKKNYGKIACIFQN